MPRAWALAIVSRGLKRRTFGCGAGRGEIGRDSGLDVPTDEWVDVDDLGVESLESFRRERLLCRRVALRSRQYLRLLSSSDSSWYGLRSLLTEARYRPLPSSRLPLELARRRGSLWLAAPGEARGLWLAPALAGEDCLEEDVGRAVAGGSSTFGRWRVCIGFHGVDSSSRPSQERWPRLDACCATVEWCFSDTYKSEIIDPLGLWSR